MGLFVNVDRLAGSVVVLGAIRRASFDGGVLSIEGLQLTDAMDVLRALGSDTLTTVKLNGVLPPVPAVANVHHPMQAAEQPDKVTAAALAPAPVVPPPAAPVAAPPPVAPVAPSAPVEAPPAPVAPPPASAPPAPPAEAPAANAIPAEVASAQTLRPIIVFFYEERGLRDLTSMCAALRAASKELKLVAKILQEDPTKLDGRIEKTMTTMGYLS